jgi:glycosyltransferase involved in cell wall biosynthesis
MMLSVICPTYNRADLLHECVTPLMQLAPGLVEVIIVSDCSTDDTEAVCASLISQHGVDRIRYTYLPYNSGAQVARNVGISVARGDYLMFVDSDDQPRPDGIYALLSVLHDNSCLDFVYGKVIRTDEAFVPLANCLPIGSVYTDQSADIAGYHWHTMGAIYRRELVQRVGPWNTSLTGSQDWEYQARVKMAGSQGQYIDTLVGYWRHHSGLRVGARTFRLDYVRSVMKACNDILSQAFIVNRRDASLESRIARKLFIHALELGANGHADLRQSCLRQAATSLQTPSLLRVALFLYSYIPVSLDGTIRFLLLSS